MKKLSLILISIVVILGCSEVGGFSDQAKILKAQGTIVKLRNALEEYRFDKGSYPGNKSDWVNLISPYFTKEVVFETKDITDYKMVLMSSDNTISQVTGVITEFRRKSMLADSSLVHNIFVTTTEIDSLLGLLEIEIRTGRRIDMDNPIPYFEKLNNLITNIDINERKKYYMDKIASDRGRIVKSIESLKTTVEGIVILDDTTKALVEYLKTSIDTIYSNATKISTTTFSEKGLPNTDIPLNKVMNLLDPKKNILELDLIEKLRSDINNYKNNYWNIEFLNYLVNFKKKLPTTMNLLKDFLNKQREQTFFANSVMNVYNYLDKLRLLVSYYRSSFGGLPKGDLSVYFADSLYYKDGIHLISSNPSLEIKDGGYIIKCNARNKENTEVRLIVNYINNLQDLIKESFAATPEYYTSDSTITFFLKAQAKDVLKSIITTRPEFTFIPEKETTKVQEKTKTKPKTRRPK